jgi:16S rRNA processing protein RimM
MTAARKRGKSAGSGSPSTGEPEYLVVGSLRRPHGLHGEMIMEVLTDFPERLKPGVSVYVGAGHQPMLIESSRPHHEGLLIKFKDIQSPEAAGGYRNQYMYVTASDRPELPKGYYYEHQLIGFSVVEAEAGEAIGTLSEIMHTPANDIYVVARPGGGEVLLPVIASVVLAIDATEHVIRVHLLPGLLEDEGS